MMYQKSILQCMQFQYFKFQDFVTQSLIDFVFGEVKGLAMPNQAVKLGWYLWEMC